MTIGRSALGAYLGVVQLLFGMTWFVYVIFLPSLLEKAGLPRTLTIYVLMADQIVFAVTDLAMGVASDRIARGMGRLGGWLLGATVVSTVAFLLIPVVAVSGGSAAKIGLLAAIFVWALTSSALRAPVWAMLGKHASSAAMPWLATLTLTGMAVGGAISPYLGGFLKDIDPRVPFALSGLTLLAVCAGLVLAERAAAKEPVPGPQPAKPPMPGNVALFFVAVALLALGFQVYFFLNAAGQYLRFAKPVDLDYLMPVFWVGFNLFMFPGAALAKRLGALKVIVAGSCLGGLGMILSVSAGSLSGVVAGQLVAGGGWGCVLMAAFSATTDFGRTGREGTMIGVLSALFAVATFGRMAVVAAGGAAAIGGAAVLAWTPAALWSVAAALALVVAVTAGRRESIR